MKHTLCQSSLVFIPCKDVGSWKENVSLAFRTCMSSVVQVNKIWFKIFWVTRMTFEPLEITTVLWEISVQEIVCLRNLSQFYLYKKHNVWLFWLGGIRPAWQKLHNSFFPGLTGKQHFHYYLLIIFEYSITLEQAGLSLKNYLK